MHQLCVPTTKCVDGIDILLYLAKYGNVEILGGFELCVSCEVEEVVGLA